MAKIIQDMREQYRIICQGILKMEFFIYVAFTLATGGGEAARQRHQARNKLLSRDRIDALLDTG